MEQRMRKYLFAIVGLLYFSFPALAQHPTYDDQKEKQWKSMENSHGTFPRIGIITCCIRSIVAVRLIGNGDSSNPAGEYGSRRINPT